MKAPLTPPKKKENNQIFASGQNDFNFFVFAMKSTFILVGCNLVQHTADAMCSFVFVFLPSTLFILLCHIVDERLK